MQIKKAPETDLGKELAESSFVFHLVYKLPAAGEGNSLRSEEKGKELKKDDTPTPTRTIPLPQQGSSSRTAETLPQRPPNPTPSGPWPGADLSSGRVKVTRTTSGSVKISTGKGQTFEVADGRRYDGGYLLVGPSGEVAIAYPKDLHSSIRPYGSLSVAQIAPPQILQQPIAPFLVNPAAPQPGLQPPPFPPANQIDARRQALMARFRAQTAAFYLFLKLCVLMYFLVDFRDTRRSISVITAALLIFAGQIGALAAARGFLQELFGTPQIPIPPPPQPAQAPAPPPAPARPAENAEGAVAGADAAAVPPIDGETGEAAAAAATAGDVGTPDDLANRLIQEQQQRNADGVRGVYRNVERVIGGIIASLVPDAREIQAVMINQGPPDEPMEAGVQG